MSIIKQIESSGNPKAYNKYSKARGLYQITPICLKEWNNYHPTEQYKVEDLFVASVNERIANWYLHDRIPKMLRYYKREASVRNILIAYNAGIQYVVSGKPIPTETRNYLIKYERRR